MEAIAEVTSSAVKAAGEMAAERVAARYEDHYQEPEVRRALLSQLRQIKDDTEALRLADFEAALQAMKSWHDCPADLRSVMRMEYLRRASAHAAKAFGVVKEAADKIRAASLLIFADYHLIALSGEGDPDWITGKRAAQRLLRQYAGGLKQLATAAEEETGSALLRVFRDKARRRTILRDFSKLSAAVFWLHPHSENGAHPHFPHLEGAVLHACESDGSYVMLPTIGHFISEPHIRGTLKGHTDRVWFGYVSCCSVFANGTRAVSGSWDNTLKVWDLATGEEMHTLTGHTGWVWCCSVFEQDTRLVSGSGDKTLKVWDLATGEEIQTLKGHTVRVWCCAVFANCTKLVSGSDDHTLKVWDLATGDEIQTLKGHTGRVNCCAVFANGTKLVSGSGDHTLKVWDLATGEEIRSLEGHANLVCCCSVFAQDTRVVSGSWDRTLKVWDFASGEEMCTLRGHAGNVTCCAVFAQGLKLVSGSEDGTLKVWELPSALLPQRALIERDRG